MLITFSVENYRSFAGRADFSLFPAYPKQDNKNINTITASDGKSLSAFSSAVIYGANGSGKSNLFKAMKAMSTLMTSNKPDNLEYLIKPCLARAETETRPTEFDINFIGEDKVMYKYGFLATNEIVHKEWLWSYPKGKQRVMYERVLVNKETKEYKYVNKLTGIRRAWESMTRPDKLFLPVAIDLNNKQLLPVYNWANDNIVIEGLTATPITNTVNYCLNGGKREVINFLNKADMNIIDIDIHKYGNKVFVILTYKTADGRLIQLNLQLDESRGRQKMFAISYTILDALKHGKVLFMDELDNSLHPLLTRHIIAMFNDKKVNKNGAQLICSAHDSSHFREREFQKDQIWICDTSSERESNLYSLIEYKMTNDDNLPARYLSGRFGGVPNIE